MTHVDDLAQIFQSPIEVKTALDLNWTLSATEPIPMLLKGIEMDNTSSQTAIACTLNSAEIRERRALARRTVIPNILTYERLSNGIVLVFENSTTGRMQVDEFIALEQGCCGFLAFDLASPDGLLRLTITGPEDSETVIDTFVNAAQESPHVRTA